MKKLFRIYQNGRTDGLVGLTLIGIHISYSLPFYSSDLATFLEQFSEEKNPLITSSTCNGFILKEMFKNDYKHIKDDFVGMPFMWYKVGYEEFLITYETYDEDSFVKVGEI